MNNRLKVFIITLSSLFLFNCGGGGSSESEEQAPVNQKPVADAGSDQSADEQTAITLEGAGSDSDGTITSFSWKQLSGEQVALSGADSETLEFTAPVAKVETSIEFELTVTDNDGATDSDSVIVTIAPVNEHKLTLRGKVTDSPIPNATVSTTVAGQTFETTSDVDGNYSLNIGVDEDADLQGLVILTAHGSEKQPEVKLLSALDSLSNLLTDAGDDAILDATENKRVNVTHVSTAVLALSQLNNNNQPPKTPEEFFSSIIKIDGEEVIKAATAIKLVIDYSEQKEVLALPDSVNDTWQFVTDIDALSGYFLPMLSLDNEFMVPYEEARELTLNDENVTLAYTETPNTYSLVRTFSFSGLDNFEFNPDGTGIYKHSTVDQSFTWQLNNNELFLDLAGEVIAVSYPSVQVDDNNYQQVEAQIIHDSIVIKLLQDSEQADIVSYTINKRTHYPNNPELEDELSATHSVRTLAKTFIPFAQEDILGKLTLPLNATILSTWEDVNSSHGTFRNSREEGAANFEFYTNGTVISDSDILGEGSWEISNEGILTINLFDAVLSVKKLRADYVAVEIKDFGSNYLGYTADTVITQSTSWTTENIPGIYELPWKFAYPRNQFVLELYESGTGKQGSIPVSWRLENGKVIVERYQDVNGSACETLRADCYVFNRRTMDLRAIDGDKYYATNRHQFNYWIMHFNTLSDELREQWSIDITDVRYWVKHDLGSEASTASKPIITPLKPSSLPSSNKKEKLNSSFKPEFYK